MIPLIVTAVTIIAAVVAIGAYIYYHSPRQNGAIRVSSERPITQNGAIRVVNERPVSARYVGQMTSQVDKFVPSSSNAPRARNVYNDSSIPDSSYTPAADPFLSSPTSRMPLSSLAQSTPIRNSIGGGAARTLTEPFPSFDISLSHASLSTIQPSVLENDSQRPPPANNKSIKVSQKRRMVPEDDYDDDYDTDEEPMETVDRPKRQSSFAELMAASKKTKQSSTPLNMANRLPVSQLPKMKRGLGTTADDEHTDRPVKRVKNNEILSSYSSTMTARRPASELSKPLKKRTVLEELELLSSQDSPYIQNVYSRSSPTKASSGSGKKSNETPASGSVHGEIVLKETSSQMELYNVDDDELMSTLPEPMTTTIEKIDEEYIEDDDDEIYDMSVNNKNKDDAAIEEEGEEEEDEDQEAIGGDSTRRFDSWVDSEEEAESPKYEAAVITKKEVQHDRAKEKKRLGMFLSAVQADLKPTVVESVSTAEVKE